MFVELMKGLFTSEQSDSLRTETRTCSENRGNNESAERLEKAIRVQGRSSAALIVHLPHVSGCTNTHTHTHPAVGRGSRSGVSGADQWGWHESLRNRVTSSQYFMPSTIKSKPKNPQRLSLFLIFNSVASPVPSSHFTCLQLKKKYRQGEESKLPGKYPASTGRADASSRTSAPLWLTD